jgi:YfiH family protein
VTTVPPATGRETPVTGPVPRMELTDWGSRFGVVAGITTRAKDFNLGLLTGAPARDVTGRWRTLAAAMRPRFPAMVAGLQVHRATVAVHKAGLEGWTIQEGVDGHVTSSAGLLLLVSVADCVPVYLCHPESHVVGLLHAGWRGAAAGILEAGVATMIRVGGPVNEIVMHCGVGICGSCYEVGPEVIEAVTGRTTSTAEPLDLRAELARRALALGVGEVSVSPWCAAHDGAHFYSHRRSSGRDGRMLAYVGRPLEPPVA